MEDKKAVEIIPIDVPVGVFTIYAQPRSNGTCEFGRSRPPDHGVYTDARDATLSRIFVYDFVDD